MRAAAASHKRIILDFGGNWCPDCQVLDIYFHDSANKSILDANYILVHVNIGRQDENLALAAHYRIPVKDGVPALCRSQRYGKAALQPGERRIQAHEEHGFEVGDQFLLQWKPNKHGCSLVQVTC